MTKPVIFISHSAKDDFAVRVRDTLYTKLEEAGFDPFMDKRDLQVGDEWRRAILSMLGKSDTGIILFSSDALISPWVKQEALMLAIRRSQDPGFLIIPVLLPPVTSKELDTDPFSQIAMKEIQAARGDVDTVLNQILERLAPLRESFADGPLKELEDVIDFILKPVYRDQPQKVRDAAKALGADAEKWSAHIVCRLLARQLLKVDLSTLPKAIEALKILAPYLDRNAGNKMVTILTSLWVDEHAVKQIPEISKRPLAQRTIRVNGIKPDTGKMYILRACRKIPGWTVLRITNEGWAEQQFGALVREIRAAYTQAIGGSTAYEDADIDSDLEDPPENDPLFVVIPKGLDNEILSQLRQKYPGITFFIITEDIPSNLEELQRNYIEFLRPPLGPGVEKKAHYHYRQAQIIVTQSNRS